MNSFFEQIISFVGLYRTTFVSCLLNTTRWIPFKPKGIQPGYSFRCHVTNLCIFVRHNVATVHVKAELTTLLEHPVCKGLILGICGWYVAVTMIFRWYRNKIIRNEWRHCRYSPTKSIIASYYSPSLNFFNSSNRISHGVRLTLIAHLNPMSFKFCMRSWVKLVCNPCCSFRYSVRCRFTNAPSPGLW